MDELHPGVVGHIIHIDQVGYMRRERHLSWVEPWRSHSHKLLQAASKFEFGDGESVPGTFRVEERDQRTGWTRQLCWRERVLFRLGTRKPCPTRDASPTNQNLGHNLGT